MTEKYLIDDYNIIEDRMYLSSEEQICDYIEDNWREFVDLDGECDDYITRIIKIDDMFYETSYQPVIDSVPNHLGDDMYYSYGVQDIRYKEIPKPKPIKRLDYELDLSMSIEELNKLKQYLKDNNIKLKLSTENKYSAQLKYCSDNNIPCFSPEICPSCSIDTFKNITLKQASKQLITKCSNCSKSFIS